MSIIVQEYLTRFAWLSEVFSQYLEKQDQIEMLNPVKKMNKIKQNIYHLLCQFIHRILYWALF